MKIDRQKYELARARACMGQKDLEAVGIPKGTLCRIIGGKDLRPENPPAALPRLLAWM